MKHKSTLPDIVAGATITCDTLSWNDGWEFDHPSMMLRPVIRCFESGAGHDQIVEKVMIDAVCDGQLQSEDFREMWGWRGYKLTTLRRRFREALRGKRFPQANYHAKRSVVRITKDEDGELGFEDVPQK